MIQLTIEEILKEEPCDTYARYSERTGKVVGPTEHLRGLFGERAEIPLAEALESDRIPVQDRQWLISRFAPYETIMAASREISEDHTASGSNECSACRSHAVAVARLLREADKKEAA